MAGVHPIVLIVVGFIVAFVSWINPEARPKLVLFFWVGVIMLVYGIFRFVQQRKVKEQKTPVRPKKATEDVQPQVYYQSQNQQNSQHVWQHNRQHMMQQGFPQHQQSVQPTVHQQQNQQIVICPQCKQQKYAMQRYCPHCGYGV